ncbi:hypothetical protein GCM10023168_11520 [Fodinibacter luteus]|uniref:Uncharacterized protein n=1 Tax=Fodinibacter luteus TaxID=552064 RepID=A0ABP8K781_9MICO
MVRGIVAVGFVALALAGMPAAAADLVVDAKTVATRGDDGVPTATIAVINTGPDAVTLSPSADAGVLPATVVSPPQDEPSNWAPLWWGIFVGLLLAVTVALRGWTEREGAESAERHPTAQAKRNAAYRDVQQIVGARMRGLVAEELPWKPALEPPVYGLRSVVGNLEAGWSFKDSWVSNITVASTALVALLGSADALTAVLGEEPEAALGVMTVAGLVSAALVGIANTVLKLVGERVTDVTVGGLILSTGIVVFAAGLQVWTVAVAAMDSVGWGAAGVGTLLLALVVTAALGAYGFRSLGEAVRRGVSTSLPAVPETALTDWAAPQGWQRMIVAARIRAEYADWLEPPAGDAVADGHPRVPTWEPVAPATRRHRRAALL